MKIDHDYLKRMLEAFEAAPTPIFRVSDFRDAGLEFQDDEFIFHIGILTDHGFIAREDRKPGFGLEKQGGLGDHQERFQRRQY